MKQRLIKGLDVGAGFCKYWTSSGQGYFPSVFALEEPGVDFAGLAAKQDDLIMEWRGQRIAGGCTVYRLSNLPRRTLDSSRVLTDDYKTLFALLLAASSEKSGVVEPVLQLPIAWYERRAQVKRFLADDYEIQVNGRALRFEVPEETIRIVPDGFGTVCAQALDSSGRGRDGRFHKRRVGVVDLGTKTVDLSLFEDMVFVPVKSKGWDTGLERVYNIMEREGENELGYRFSWEALDRAINGQAALMCGPQDVTDRAIEWKYQALEQVAAIVAGNIRTLWQGGNDAQEILLTGGGAAHVYPWLVNEFSHLTIADNPAMSNVIGLYNYGVMKARTQHVPA